MAFYFWNQKYRVRDTWRLCVSTANAPKKCMHIKINVEKAMRYQKL